MEGQIHKLGRVAWLPSILLVLTVSTLAQNQSSDTNPEDPAGSTPAEPSVAQSGASDAATVSDEAETDRPVESESALVRAAREGRKNRGQSRILITDDDVKKSRGKLIEVSGSLAKNQTSSLEATKPGEEPPKSEVPEVTPERRAEMRRHYEKLIETRTEAVRELEKELDGIEEEYYIEDDPAIRDHLHQRFEEAQRELESARQSLAEAQKDNDEFRRRYD